MKKVGITGGIGSGKTTACKVFESIGVPVYYADERARDLMVENQELRQAIQELLGEESYTEDGELNREYVGEIIFKDKSKLDDLNKLVHPAVRKDSENWFNNQSDVPYALKEAALLIESGSHKELDILISVTANEELRIERVMQRDNVDRKFVELRIKNQMPQEDKDELADYVIYNNGTQPITNQVRMIHRAIIDE